MSALGYAATGAGQGYLEGQQERYGRQQQRRQYGLQERQVGLAEKGQLQDEAFRREQAARGELDKQDAYLNSPEFSTKLSPEQQARIRDTFGARRSRIYRDFPTLSDSAFAEDNTDQSSTSPGATPPIAPNSTPSPFASVQPGTAPDGSPMAVLPEPTGPAPATATAPTAGPPAPTNAPPQNQSLYDFFSAQAHDTSLPLETRNAAAAQAMQIRQAEAGIRGTEANTAGTIAATKEIAPNAADQRATGREGRLSSQYDRNVYKPTLLDQGQQQIELNKLIAKGKAGGGGLTVQDRIRIMELQNTINQQAIARQDKQGETQYQHGKDAAEYQQREDLATQRTQEADRAAIRGAIVKSVMTVDPLTNAPIMKPGGLAEVQRLITNMHSQGKQVTAEDMNPGYPPSVWAKVNDPGMTEQTIRAAVQNALVNGDRHTAILIKNAWAATRMMAGGGKPSTPAKSAARPAAKPAPRAQPKPVKTQYSYGGGRGEERR